MTLRDEVQCRRLKYYERQLNEITAQVKGQNAAFSDRISAILDQIGELEKVVKALVERVERMASFLEELRAERNETDIDNG